MAKKITNESFIDSNFLQPAIDRVKELVSVIGDLQNKLKDIGKESSKALEGLNAVENVKDAQKLNEVLERLAKTEEQLSKLQDEKQKNQIKLKSLQEEQIAIQKKQIDQTQKLNKSIEEKLKIEIKEINTIKGLKDQNKELTKALEGVNLETEEGIKAYKEIANQIEDNNDKIKGLRNQIKLERKERELQKAAIKAEQESLQGLIKTKEEARAANKALLASVAKLDTTTEKERIDELNAIIDQNNQLIEENSDKYSKSKINIGRYTESINQALEGNEDFQKIQQGINVVLGISQALFKKDEKEVEKNKKQREELTEANENLEKSSEDVNKSLRNNIIGVIITGFTTILGLFSQTEEGAQDFKVLFAQVGVVIQLAFERAKSFALVAVDSFKRAGKEIEVFLLKAQKLNIFGDNTETDKKIKGLETEILSLNDSIDKNLTRTTVDFTKVLQENLKSIEDLTIAEIKYEKNLANISKQLVLLTGEEEKLKALRDSDTDSLEERNKAGIEAIKVGEQVSRVELQLARERVKLAEERIEIELKAAGIINLTAAQIRNVTNLDEIRGKVNTTSLQAQTDALIELQTKENEFILNQIENQEQLALIRRDIFERNLDDQIDFFDNVKAINERIIADETTTLEAKVKAQETIRIEGEKTFKRQIELIEENKKADLQAQIERLKVTGGSIAEIEKKEQELANFKIDAQKILAIENAQEFNEEIRRLGLSEIAENRSLEVFRERRNIRQDERDIQKDIFQQTFDELKLDEELLATQKELAEIQRLNAEQLRISQIKDLDERKQAIEKFNEDQTKIEKAADEERLENEIETLNKEIDERIKAGEDGSKKVQDLQLELAQKEVELNRKKLDTIEDDNKKALEKEEEEQKKALEKRKELFETAVLIAENFLQKRNEEQLKKLDDQIQGIEERQSALRTLAENGNEEAVKSLAESEKEEAKIRQEKEKELQRQKQIEAGLAAFKLLAAKAEEDPKTALPETLSEILTLSTFVNALPAFFDGTENIGKSMGKPHLNTSRDAYLSVVEGMGVARLDGGERIINSEDNKALGNISNEELTRLAQQTKEGAKTFKSFENRPNSNIVSVGPNSARLEGIMRENNEILKRLPSNMARTTDTFDSKTGVLTQVMTYNNTKVRTHKKIFVPIRKNN